jgi:hypothetical protein
MMATRGNLHAAKAGLAYFLVVFAAGFAIGVLRVLFATPRLGETVAVLFELPFMLALSWLACRWLVTSFGVGPALSSRAAMGGVALVLLLAAEFGIASLAFERALADHLQYYRGLPTLLGLVGLIAFAAFPMFVIACNVTALSALTTRTSKRSRVSSWHKALAYERQLLDHCDRGQSLGRPSDALQPYTKADIVRVRRPRASEEVDDVRFASQTGRSRFIPIANHDQSGLHTDEALADRVCCGRHCNVARCMFCKQICRNRS